MARRLFKDGKIIAIEFSVNEFANILDITIEDLIAWTDLLPPAEGEGEGAIYRVSGKGELEILKKRAKVLTTRMTEEAVLAVEKAGMLDSYAALAEDCPEGVTAHIWRSYGLIVLMQGRYGQMIGPEELAERAGLVEADKKTGKMKPSVDIATRHIRILQALGLLEAQNDRWEHQGLPLAWR
jgi:hypothetical protein